MRKHKQKISGLFCHLESKSGRWRLHQLRALDLRFVHWCPWNRDHRASSPSSPAASQATRTPAGMTQGRGVQGRMRQMAFAGGMYVGKLATRASHKGRGERGVGN